MGYGIVDSQMGGISQCVCVCGGGGGLIHPNLHVETNYHRMHCYRCRAKWSLNYLIVLTIFNNENHTVMYSSKGFN